jgi:hypothetical protein
MPDTTAARPSQDTRSSLDRRPPPAASHPDPAGPQPTSRGIRSAASYTSICRSHDMTEFSAPTGPAAEPVTRPAASPDASRRSCWQFWCTFSTPVPGLFLNRRAPASRSGLVPAYFRAPCPASSTRGWAGSHPTTPHGTGESGRSASCNPTRSAWRMSATTQWLAAGSSSWPVPTATAARVAALPAWPHDYTRRPHAARGPTDRERRPATAGT